MINLWDLLVRQSNREPGPAQQRAHDDAARLVHAAGMLSQNISLFPREDGWVVRIHSTCETGEVEVFIPKQRDQTVAVLKDTRPASQILEFATLYRAGLYSDAARIADDALTASEDSGGFDAPERPRLLYHLAIAYMKRGNYHRAEILFDQAVESAETSPAFDNAGRVRFFNDWALLHYFYRCTTESDYIEAESRFMKALSLAEAMLGQRHPDRARVMTGLARLRLSQFRYNDARDLLTQALEIREQALGPDHEDVAETLQELGKLHSHQEDNEESQLAFQRALKIREQALGPFHPEVADVLFNLADLYYYNKTEHGVAADLMARALDIWEHSLGLRHPLVEREGNFIKTVLPALAEKAAEVEQVEEFDDDVEF